MRKVQIITDSCSDLTPELMKRHNVDYARMNTVLDGKTSPARLDWSEDDVHAFYNVMREGRRITTTQVPVEEFNRVFRQYLEQDCDIVYVACSSKQSGSVNTAAVLARKLTREYPGAQIFAVDSLNASVGEGMLAIEAANLRDAGLSAKEIASRIQSRLKQVNEFCTVHSLDALRRAGRVKASAAFFGNLMGVKPIIVADANGEQAAFKKVKGRQTSLHEIVTLLRDNLIEPEKQTVYLAHADCSAQEVEQVEALIRAEIPCKDVYVCNIGPIIGASIGPDAVAVFGLGQEVVYRIGE